jgi:hypothetical protein
MLNKNKDKIIKKKKITIKYNKEHKSKERKLPAEADKEKKQ